MPRAPGSDINTMGDLPDLPTLRRTNHAAHGDTRNEVPPMMVVMAKAITTFPHNETQAAAPSQPTYGILARMGPSMVCPAARHLGSPQAPIRAPDPSTSPVKSGAYGSPKAPAIIGTPGGEATMCQPTFFRGNVASGTCLSPPGVGGACADRRVFWNRYELRNWRLTREAAAPIRRAPARNPTL